MDRLGVGLQLQGREPQGSGGPEPGAISGVERLFGVSLARAAQLMRTFGAELVGAARVLRRSELLRQLRKYRERAAFRGEEQRRARLVTELRQARLTGILIPARRVVRARVSPASFAMPSKGRSSKPLETS